VDLALRGAAALVPTSVDVIRTLRESATRGRCGGGGEEGGMARGGEEATKVGRREEGGEG
jgi:hypothetical protein